MNLQTAMDEFENESIRAVMSLQMRASELKLLSELGDVDLLSNEKLELWRKIRGMICKTVDFDSEVLSAALEDADFIHPCLCVLGVHQIDFDVKNSNGLSYRDIIHDKHKSTFDLLQMANLIE